MPRNRYGNKRHRKEAVKVLKTAVEVLDATGWCLGKLGDYDIDRVDGDGAHCALGSIAAGANINGEGVYDPYFPDEGSAYETAVQAVFDSISQADLDKKTGKSRYSETLRVVLANDEYGDYTPAEIIFRWNDQIIPKDKVKGKTHLKRTIRRAIKRLAA